MGTTSNQFRIDLPDGWEDRTVYLYMGPDDSGVQHMMQLIVDPDTGGVDLAEYARNRIDAVMVSLQGAEILKEEEKILDNGRTVYECVYKWVPVDGQIMFNKVVYMIMGKSGYTFSANFSKKTIKTIGVEVDRIIDSFMPGIVQTEEED